MKTHTLLFTAIFSLILAQSAQADVHEAAHDVKEGTVHVVKKTGKVVHGATRATGHAFRAVGHGIGRTVRKGYHGTKNAVHKAAE